jgi:hypothetical protein
VFGRGLVWVLAHVLCQLRDLDDCEVHLSDLQNSLDLLEDTLCKGVRLWFTSQSSNDGALLIETLFGCRDGLCRESETFQIADVSLRHRRPPELPVWH